MVNDTLSQRAEQARTLQQKSQAQAQAEYRRFVIDSVEMTERGTPPQAEVINYVLSETPGVTHDQYLQDAKDCVERRRDVPLVEQGDARKAARTATALAKAAAKKKAEAMRAEAEAVERSAHLADLHASDLVRESEDAWRRVLATSPALARAFHDAVTEANRITKRLELAEDAATWNRRAVDDLATRIQTMDEDHARAALADLSMQRARLADADRLPTIRTELKAAQAAVEAARHALLTAWGEVSL
jgi:hypothetical protein